MVDLQTHAGFEPLFNAESRVLILGSFPSVKSRAVAFYYGNPRNRFWRMLCDYFHESVPETVEGKRALLLRRKIALWDMVTECAIVGSSDASVRNAKVADLSTVTKTAKIEKFLLNGALAWRLFAEYYPERTARGVKLPSTSPANPRYDERAWHGALDEVFTP